MKAILTCTIPVMVAALVMFPFLAIIGGSPDPFLWERSDRIFYFICVVCFGYAIYCKVDYSHKVQE